MLEIIIFIFVIVFTILSIVYSFKYKFVQFKSFKKTKDILLKDKNKSCYQTFLVSLASHMGTGNIIGVCSALIIGGAGSLFWMWFLAIFSSIFALMENTIAQSFKLKIDNEYRGGSSYYILGGLNKKILALLIAIFLVLSNSILFQPLQVNTVSESFYLLTNIDRIYIFLLLLLLCLFVIFRGTKKIVKFSELIVPFISITYCLIGFVVILINYKYIPKIIISIFQNAFTFKSFLGGCVFIGLKRSLFSHEAGLGTMPTISSMANPNKASDQGFICCFGIFIDTIVMCSLTGIMILVYNIDFNNLNLTGVELIIYVFNNIFNKFGKVIAIFFMITFALATVVSQYYLGESNLLFISLYTKKKKLLKFIYKILFIMGLFIGVFLHIDYLWGLIDIGLVILGGINLYAIIKLSKQYFTLN